MAKKTAAIILLAIVMSILFAGCQSGQRSDGVTVRDAEEFFSAIQNKETIIYCEDLTFEENTAIQINYGLTICGKDKKAIIKNACFNIVSPNTSDGQMSVRFENVVLDGGVGMPAAEQDKTFEEVFGSEREDKRCITADWGYTYLTLKNVEITGYASVEGSALFMGNTFRAEEQTLTIENCDFHGNVARNGTIKVFNDKLTTKISNSRFYENTVGAAGGFVISNGKATVDNCKIYNNAYYAFDDLGFEERGGGVYFGGGDVEMTDCLIKNNETIRGGGLAVSSAFSGNGNMLIKRCRIENNRAKYGGAVFVTSLQGQPIDFIGCEFYGNTATGKGSILYTLPYAHWTKKYKGGQVNVLFSSAANNTATDDGTFGFYEAEGLVGYIVLKGCLIVDDAAYSSGEKSYNYIATATAALNDGAINDLNIAENERLQAVKGSDADIVVPAGDYEKWNGQFAGATADCHIGEYVEPQETAQINDHLLTIVIISVCAGLLAAGAICVVVLRKRTQKAKAATAENDGETADESTAIKEATIEDDGAKPVQDEENKPATQVGTSEEALLATWTEREYKIVALTLAGKTREQIAAELRFSVGTIKFDLTDIYRKLNCSSRTDLIIRYKDFF